MLGKRFTLVVLVSLLVACHREQAPDAQSADTQKTNPAKSKDGAQAKNAPAAAEKPLLVAAEDMYILHKGEISSGTVISGSIAPEKRADLRSEIQAVVVQVLKENGERVKKGELLVRLDDTAIRDALRSSEESVRAAAQSLDQSERQYQRLKTLRASGMVSMQQLEDAEVHRNNSQSDLVAAKAREAQARQQLQRTEVRAPFDGSVSERKVSIGDSTQPGKELIKVIDPASLRLEGLVAADRIGSVKLGQSVSFRVNGYGDQQFQGKVKRIDASADPVTRQVAVLVSMADASQAGVSGLYAEGRIETDTATGLVVPEASVVREGDTNYVWRVRNNVLNKVAVKLGRKDARRGDLEVLDGLADGEQLIRNPQSNLKDGAKVESLPVKTAMADTKGK